MKSLGMMRMRRPQARPSRSRQSHDAIDVEASINSGQVFLWEKDGDMWYGVDGGQIVAVDQTSKKIRTQSGRLPDIFRKSDDMKKILREISHDSCVALAVRRFRGMRLMRQNPFQCMITFITSANSNIPRIRNTLFRLCAKYGSTAELDGKKFSLFPKPEALAGARIRGLESCGLGYRARYVRDAASMVASGRIDLDALAGAPYEDAFESLLGVAGVGSKVADCVLLFSLEKLEAFPLDRWMSRILAENYPHEDFGRMIGMTPKRYAEAHARILGRFGPYAGYAQQFLFKMGRDEANGAWAVEPED